MFRDGHLGTAITSNPEAPVVQRIEHLVRTRKVSVRFGPGVIVWACQVWCRGLINSSDRFNSGQVHSALSVFKERSLRVAPLTIGNISLLLQPMQRRQTRLPQQLSDRKDVIAICRALYVTRRRFVVSWLPRESIRHSEA